MYLNQLLSWSFRAFKNEAMVYVNTNDDMDHANTTQTATCTLLGLVKARHAKFKKMQHCLTCVLMADSTSNDQC